MAAHSAVPPPDASVVARPNAPLLEATDVDFAFGRNKVLEGVSLHVDPGSFVALVGPNGSGKSTLLRVLLGSLSPSAGSVRLFGESPDRVGERWRLGYVPQRPVLASEVPATVQEIVMAGRLARRGWWRPLSRRTARPSTTRSSRSAWKSWDGGR